MHKLMAAVAVLWATAATPQQMDLFSLGSGDLSGTYYATASAICERINRNPDRRQLRCSPEPTQGSIYNLAKLRDGEQEFALVQSDWQSAAWTGSSLFSGIGPQTDLRSVMALYPETITVLAGLGSGIRAAPDLLGKRVEIGLPSSGRRATVVELLSRLGMSTDVFSDTFELSPNIAVQELCNGRIDAVMLVTGHPNPLVADAIERCGARLMPMDGPDVSAALGATPEFQSTVIPANTYLGQTEDVGSWSVYATIVTRAGTPDRMVEAMVTGVLDNRAWLGRHVPALADLDPQRMQSRALTAPLHPAAERAFAEAAQ
jgi:TRAP transporter TAXI family solute receptor